MEENLRAIKKWLEQLMHIFICQPYSSWERGNNENTNGMIKQYVPKNSDFTTINHEIQTAMRKLNHRPRKKLDLKLLMKYFMK